MQDAFDFHSATKDDTSAGGMDERGTPAVPQEDAVSVTSADGARWQPSASNSEPEDTSPFSHYADVQDSFSDANLCASLPSNSVSSPLLGTSGSPPNFGAKVAHESVDDARSAGDAITYTVLQEAVLRDIYHAGEEAIQNEAKAMMVAGQSEERVARWATQARNALRQEIRSRGEPIIEKLAKAIRGIKDMPTYEQLRNKGKTDQQIIESASKSNQTVNRWVGRLRICGRLFIAIDVGVSGYRVVSAPAIDRPKVMLQEAGRLGGALSGAALGANLGRCLGALGFMGGGIVGGLIGAIGGGRAGKWVTEWAIEDFYPPDDTQFEGSYE